MIEIKNKFDLGQEVYYITKQQISETNKRKIWVAIKEPLKIYCIYYKNKLKGSNQLLYNIEPYGKTHEENLFPNYESAVRACKRRNGLDN